MWSHRPVCSRCECELPWDEVWLRGAVFCCWGCAQGRPCESGENCGEAGKGFGGGIAGPPEAGQRAGEAFRGGFN